MADEILQTEIVVTEAADFIGVHEAKRILEAGHEMRKLDSLNAHYDMRLKHSRLAVLGEKIRFISSG